LVASAHVRDLLVHGKYLLEGAKHLFIAARVGISRLNHGRTEDFGMGDHASRIVACFVADTPI